MLEKLPESVGHALINQRAGMENVVYNQLFRLRATARLEVRSKAFAFNARLPVRFTADGEGISPPLDWGKVPENAGSIALIVEDADSPTPHPLVHAIVVNLGGSDGAVQEGAFDSPGHEGAGFAMGQNSFFKRAWLPPDPPRGHGEHRYVFQVFALRGGPVPGEAPGRGAFIDMVLERAVAVGCLIGTYERTERVEVDDTERSAAEQPGWVQEAGAG
jgi:hypothetical protein